MKKMNFNTAKLMAKKIVSKMTIEEKASQLLYNSPAIFTLLNISFKRLTRLDKYR